MFLLRHQLVVACIGLGCKDLMLGWRQVPFLKRLGAIFEVFMDFKHRSDLPELAKSYLFNIKIDFENVPQGKEEFFDNLAKDLSIRCRKMRFLKEQTSDVYTVVEVSFDEFEDYLITTCIRREYLKSFKMTVIHYSSDMKPVYEERFFDCKAVYVEEFNYDKHEENQERLVKTIGFKCKRGM